MYKPLNTTAAFTIEYDGIVNALYTNCGIYKAFKPTTQYKINPTNFKALWDTGATDTVVSKKVVDALKLQPTGITGMVHADGKTTVNTHSVSIFLPNDVVISAIRVLECNLPSDIDILIGMDIISKGDFAITSSNGKTKFSFQMPSTHDIEFIV